MFKSIRWKFILIYFLLVFLAMSIVGIYIVNQLEKIQLDMNIKNMEARIRSIIDSYSSLKSGVWDDNIEEIQKSISSVQVGYNENIYVILNDNNRTIIAGSVEESIGLSAFNYNKINNYILTKSMDGNSHHTAPETNILSIKVLDEKGNGNTSDILSTVQWIIENKEVYKTKIINFSLGAIAQYKERRDPLVKAANRAIEENLIVVAAVGNSGPMHNTILSPATGRYVISVGSLNDRGRPYSKGGTIAEFSSRGPTLDRIRKPDLIAPGVDIMSLSNRNLSGYTTLSGTSMSAPMISGAAALLLNENPNYTHFDIKRILLNSCSKIKASAFEQGAGVLNMKRIFS
jgi:subtilisin family serine protease